MDGRISKEETIYPGRRVVLVKRHGWYDIKDQEHESICGGHVNDADADGWRTCSHRMQYTYKAAVDEMENVISDATRYCGD